MGVAPLRFLRGGFAAVRHPREQAAPRRPADRFVRVLGTDPARHHPVAALLTLGCMIGFYFVIRGLRFLPRDTIRSRCWRCSFPGPPRSGCGRPAPSTTSRSCFSSSASWSRSADWGRGPARVLIHVAATACYVASILTYEVTTAVALFAWVAYAWLGGWRAALPRMALDVPAVAAAAIYTSENTNKHVASLADQLHMPDIAHGGADLIAGTLLPVSIPAEISPVLTVTGIAAPVAVHILAALRSRAPAQADGAHRIGWPAVAATALGALVLCWAVHPAGLLHTDLPGDRGPRQHPRAYPAAVVVWAVMRAAGSLCGDGYLLAVAGAIAVAMATGSRTSASRTSGCAPPSASQSSGGGRAGPFPGRRGGSRLRLSRGDRSPRPRLERQLRPLPGGAAGDLERDRATPCSRARRCAARPRASRSTGWRRPCTTGSGLQKRAPQSSSLLQRRLR